MPIPAPDGKLLGQWIFEAIASNDIIQDAFFEAAKFVTPTPVPIDLLL